MEASKRRDSNAMVAAVTNELAYSVALIGPSHTLYRTARRGPRRKAHDSMILAANAVDEDYPSALRRVHKTFAKLN